MRKKWLAVAVDLVILALAFWVARYWTSRSFGLYEDDLTIIPDAFGRSLDSLLRFLFTYVTQLRGHARPFSDGFIYLFSWLGWRIGGFWGPYPIGYVLSLVNISLFYFLMSRLNYRQFAILSGLVFALFSADTTQAFLTHSLGLQPSITLFLLAAHAYLARRRILSYAFIFLILFSYETPFPLFYAIPLLAYLDRGWKKSLLEDIVWNGIVLTIMLLGVYLLRSAISDSRLVSFGLPQMVQMSLKNMLLGPVTVFRMFFTRPLRPLLSLDFEIGLVMGISMLVLTAVLWKVKPDFSLSIATIRHWFRAGDQKKEPFPEQARPYVRLLAIGLVMLILAYPLTFTVDALATGGRNTRVHAAAVVGASIFMGSLIMLVLAILENWKMRRLGTLLVSAWLALLVGYGFILQADYVTAWRLQRQFWTDLLPLIGDVQDGTVVLVGPDGWQDVYQIQANTWNLPRVLDQLVEFPEAYSRVPRVYRLASSLGDASVGGCTFRLDGSTVFAPPSLYGEVGSDDVILIQMIDGHPVRVNEPQSILGEECILKQPSSPGLSLLPRGLLYDLMILEP